MGALLAVLFLVVAFVAFTTLIEWLFDNPRIPIVILVISVIFFEASGYGYDILIHNIIGSNDFIIYDIDAKCETTTDYEYSNKGDCTYKAKIDNKSKYNLRAITMGLRWYDCKKGTNTCINFDLDGNCKYYSSTKEVITVNADSSHKKEVSTYFKFDVPPMGKIKGELCPEYKILETEASLFSTKEGE